MRRQLCDTVQSSMAVTWVVAGEMERSRKFDYCQRRKVQVTWGQVGNGGGAFRIPRSFNLFSRTGAGVVHQGPARNCQKRTSIGQSWEGESAA